jgi:hypothetical protein
VKALDHARRAIEFLKSWFEPHRRAAISALFKASVLLGSLWVCVWMWHIRFYSKRYPEVPISLAWSMLTVVAGVTFAQMGCSAVLKLRGARLRKLSAVSKARLTALLTSYITNGDSEEELRAGARATPRDFEECLTAALLGTRGVALERLCDLPGVTGLRDEWIARSSKGASNTRRHAVEHLGLLRDPAAVMALEVALEDANPGVVAAAARGLLRIPSYSGREELIRSLPGRPYLVRVLTACEATDEPGDREAASAQRPAAPVVAGITLLAAADAGARARPIHVPQPQQLQMLAKAVGQQSGGSANFERSSCSILAGLGPTGRDLLHLMAATGVAGEAPAEALGEVLAAAARGGRA